MTLLTRLISQSNIEDKLPVHTFMAALAEYKRGVITQQNIIDAFGLDSAEGIQLQNFLDNLDGNTIDRTLIHDVLLLGEAGHYNESKAKSRLGI